MKKNSKGFGFSSLRIGRCHFCGSVGLIVDRFPRRGYGKRVYGKELAL